MAKHYAKQIPYDADHLVLTQNLVPFLWKDGHLGGRTFDVLITRLPWKQLQITLDKAAQKYPESKTLNDFRIGREWIELEEKALQAARYLISPHSQIQKINPRKTIALKWQLPEISKTEQSIKAFGKAFGKVFGKASRFIFPAPTLGRKGAYEIREVFRELKLPLYTFAKNFEGEDFWSGVELKNLEEDWLKEAKVVILFSHVESRPNKLLEAIATGVPVIASKACGLEAISEVISIETGNAEALNKAIGSLFNLQKTRIQ